MAYPRAALPPGLESVYNASAYAGYVALGTEGSAFYTPLVGQELLLLFPCLFVSACIVLFLFLELFVYLDKIT